ncbi:hypothetical protein TWF970_006934 [Orbilia oligospora]|uniref:Uncharacterized protein n=1 Tax=Orbilia oligospora TaxID=2813651 RepID=A0A7C8RD75_ORBOL|nr:hypothetical protein TWF970_006934 [Orbilia oligospora]
MEITPEVLTWYQSIRKQIRLQVLQIPDIRPFEEQRRRRALTNDQSSDIARSKGSHPIGALVVTIVLAILTAICRMAVGYYTESLERTERALSHFTLQMEIQILKVELEEKRRQKLEKSQNRAEKSACLDSIDLMMQTQDGLIRELQKCLESNRSALPLEKLKLD